MLLFFGSYAENIFLKDKMPKVMNRKICKNILWKSLDHSESTDMHVEKNKNSVSEKNVFSRTGGEGAENYTNIRSY